MAARDAGLEAIIAEKSPYIGGSTAYSYGILWVPDNHLQKNLGIPDSIEQGREYMHYLAAGRQSEEHLESYLRNGPKALEYFERVAGVPFNIVQGLPDHYYPVAPGSLPKGRSIQVQPFAATELGVWQSQLRHSPYVERVTFEEMGSWGGRSNEKSWDKAVLAEREERDIRTFGTGLVGYFLAAALRTGAQMMAGATVERLLVEDGAVIGAEIKRGTESLLVQARKGVMVASGGYAANENLVSWFDEYPPYPTHRPPAANLGNGLILAMEQGAAIFIHHGTLSVQLAYAVPGETDEGLPVSHGANLRELAAPHSILVNRKGERFGDESFFEHISTKLREFDLWAHEYTNRPCFLIFDQDYWDSYALRPVPPGGPVPDWVVSAGSVEAVAGKLGVNQTGLAQTVERFNQFVDSGRDLDFHRGEDPWSQQVTGDQAGHGNPNLGAIRRPPFYGIELHACDAQAAGLVTSPDGQVVHVRGHAIPGLYACGDAAARMHVGVGYQAGYVLTGAMTSAYLAVQHAISQ